MVASSLFTAAASLVLFASAAFSLPSPPKFVILDLLPIQNAAVLGHL